MAVDISKQGTKGGDGKYLSSNLQGVREEKGIVIGIVKANVHGAHMGVLQVFVPGYSTNPNDKSQWRTVRYCTPYYSRVNSQGPNDDFLSTKVSSGILTPPPDLGTKVLCFFPEGKNAEGFYFAGIPDTFMLQSVPESTRNANNEPAGEFNDNESGTKPARRVNNFKRERRSTDFYTLGYTVSQGLDRDTVRGIGDSSYMRESPSELLGIVSKGRRVAEDGSDFTIKYNSQLKDKNTADKRILDGLLGPFARRKGHSITLDDGNIDGDSNQIRLRTSTGHQILLNDSEGIVYVGNANGSAWIELTSGGTMDVYAQDSINFRSKNIQFHADDNIKFHSKGYTQIVSEAQLALESKSVFTMYSDQELGINAKAGFHLNSGGNITATSKGSSFYNAGSNIAVSSGALVLLQGPKPSAKVAKKIKTSKRADVSWDSGAGQWTSEPAVLDTTVDRIVTHEPFAAHAVANQSAGFTGGLAGGSGKITGGFSILSTPIQMGGALGEFGGITSTFADAGFGTDALGEFGGIASQVTDALPVDIAAVTDALPVDISAVTSALPAEVTNITSSIPGADIQQSFGNVLQGADINKIVGDASGSFSTAFSQMQDQLPDALADFQKQVPGIQDKLGSILDTPALQNFPVTDMIKQVDTGFAVGVLDNVDTQALNAAVVKAAGSFNDPAFVDSVTKSIGKFGANVEQLKAQGYVRPEAVFNDQMSDPALWTGKGGATSLTNFLGNASLQESVQQAVTAVDYQDLVNRGAILASDGQEQIMSMLTASNMSSPEIAAKVRQGFDQIEGTLKNTTNIPEGEEIAAKVKEHLQIGAAAAKRATQVKDAKLQGVYGPGFGPADPSSATASQSAVTTLDKNVSQLQESLTSDPAKLGPAQRQALQTQLNIALAQRDKAEVEQSTPSRTVTVSGGETVTRTRSPDPQYRVSVGTVGSKDGVTTSTVVTGGGSTTTTNEVTGGAVTRTATKYDPYSGPNGARLRVLDERIEKIGGDRLGARLDGDKALEARLDEEYKAVLAERNKLGY